jgi:Kdo2-lipid IVA lauroyltransferase/acyltransferase
MFILRLLSRLPLGVLYRASDFLYFITRYVIGYRRNLVRKNLANAFPEKNSHELKQIENKFYHNLCDYVVETIKLLSIDREDLANRMQFQDADILEQYKAEGKSVIMLTAHLFNWEWMLASGSFSLPLPVDFVYQKVNNQFFDAIFLKLRTRFGAYAIERNHVARQALRRKSTQRGIAIVADQYPGQQTDKRHPVRFLNQDTVFFLGGSQLAVLTQYPVVFFGVRKISRGFYVGKFERIADPPYGKDDVDIVERYASAVEKSIRLDPANWLWSHNRWKKRHLRPRKVSSA